VSRSIWLFPVLLLNLSCLACTTPSPPTTIDLLNRMPLHTVLVDQHSIVYTDIGQGHPLIFIHGLGGSMWHWEHQQTFFSSQFRVITLDLLGSGMSDKPELEYTPENMVSFFLAFMDTLGIQQATLIGNSMGGGLAMGVALTEPARVSQLVLISGFPPNIRRHLISPMYHRMMEYQPPLWIVKLGNYLAGRWATKMALEEIIFDPQLLTPAVIDRSYHNRSNGDSFGPLLSLMSHLEKWETTFASHVSDITHPTLILWGTEDHIFPISAGQTLQMLMPHSTFTTIPQAGHLPQWEQPKIVNQQIQTFLEFH